MAFELKGSSELPYKPLIINVALTGTVLSKKDNPNIPMTPDEIAEDVCRCYAAGARVFHVHPRDENQEPSCKKEVFQEIMSKIRKKCPEALVCLTTSGRVFKTFEERSAALTLEGELKPEFATLTAGSMNLPKEPSVNHPEMIKKLATMMDEKSIRPEIEIFDSGMINYASYLARKKILKPPFYFNLFFGILGTTPGRMPDICYLVQSLPQESEWGAAGGGKFQLPTNISAMLIGGHVRTGLEDNPYYDNEKTIQATNEMLVKRLVNLSREIGRPVATAEQAREILSIPRQ